MKNLYICLFVLFCATNVAVAQEDDSKYVRFKMVPVQVDSSDGNTYIRHKLVEIRIDSVYKPKSIGLRTGFFTTIGVSYNQFFTARDAFEVNLGYRIPGGWPGQGDNTRWGLEATYQYHVPIMMEDDMWLGAFARGGFFTGIADYTHLGDHPRFGDSPFFLFGLTGGIGLDFKYSWFNFSGWWSPGFDLTSPHEASNRFFWMRTSGVAVRYILN
jgi:hypothetical protein